jgi:hypothetical protein
MPIPENVFDRVVLDSSLETLHLSSQYPPVLYYTATVYTAAATVGS